MLKSPTNLTKGSLKLVDCICDYCGGEFSQPNRNRIKGYRIIQKDACVNCRSKKREESSMAKYGVKNPSQNKEVRQKASLTKGGIGICVEDYKEQILELYQNDVSVLTIATRFNITRSVLIAFMKSLGLDTTGNVQAKREKTNKERYGHKHFIQSNKGKKSFRNYVDNRTEEETQDVLSKIRATNLEKYGTEYIVNDKTRQDEFNIKRRKTRIANGHEVEYDGKTAKVLADSIGINLSSFHERVRKVGLETAVKTTKFCTYLESMLSKCLDELNISYKTQVCIDNKIADFVLPDYNIVIETDGLYWHSDAIIKDNNYHVKKRALYIDNGYTPLFFREDEINNKLDIIQSIVLGKTGNTVKIGARKCTMAILDKKIGREFMEINHLMGRGIGTYFALKHNNTAVAVMCIKRLDNKNYEISRFCSVKNHTIQGSFSKLLKFAKSNLDMDSLVTFIDLRYGQGLYLHDFGFTNISSCPSFKWTDTRQTFHRMKFPGSSGYDNKLVKIWDCGQSKWKL